MHRSGTSALTRVISLLGADLPQDLIPPNVANEAGFWESHGLMVIHDELLTSAGSCWDDWRPLNSDWYRSPAAPVFQRRVLSVLRNHYANSKLFIIKDPRVCRFWPFYRGIIDEFGARPSVVIPIRNPLEVMASLRHRDRFVSAKTFLLWLRHTLDAEKATRDLPRAIVSYDALLSNWRGVVSRMSSALDLSWPRLGDLAALEIEEFLTTQLRHHIVLPEQLGDRAEVVDWVKDAYAAFVKLCSTPEHGPSLARLDQVGREFEKACSAFGLVLIEGESERAKCERENAQLRVDSVDLRQRLSALIDGGQHLTALESAHAKEQQNLIAEADLAVITLRAQLANATEALAQERRKVAEQARLVAELENQLQTERKRAGFAGAEAALGIGDGGIDRNALHQRLADLIALVEDIRAQAGLQPIPPDGSA
jgi:hypothetical protein